MKIAVGISGGVDSAVAAYLLHRDGNEVVGTIMKIWDGSHANIKKGNACYGPDEEEDIEDAKRICDTLGIKLHIIDCAKEYKEIVLTNFKEEYRRGRTPNPCVRCNQNIKFGILPSLLKKTGISFDRFATGHYARIVYNSDIKRYCLKKALDKQKDQTYFLYRLSSGQLSQVLFPLGHYTKTQVREIAKSAGLPVSNKDESQDFFNGDYSDLLETSDKEGNIRSTGGKILGKHRGIWKYTIGQRKGLGVFNKKPLYVLKIDEKKNEIIVGERESLFSKGLIAAECNIFFDTLPESGHAKIRSNSVEHKCHIERTGENQLKVQFNTPQSAVTPGQSVVLYDNDMVLGGGIIDSVI